MSGRQTFQAKESAPAKKSSFSWLRPAAAHPAAEAEHEAPSASSPAFAHDFTKVPVRPMQLPGVPGFSCPFTPERCPSGGACHTCPPKLQAKLKIGQPGDQYEQEADRVAETVMRMPEPQMQRKGCSAPGCKDEDEDKLVQTKSAGSAGNAQVDHPLIQSVLASPGQPLDAATRSFMEPRFGQDFSGVRVHVGGEAAESARAVNARAYTVGRDMVFGAGEYAPGSDEGKRLVAHELVHVGQQVYRGNAHPVAEQSIVCGKPTVETSSVMVQLQRDPLSREEVVAELEHIEAQIDTGTLTRNDKEVYLQRYENLSASESLTQEDQNKYFMIFCRLTDEFESSYVESPPPAPELQDTNTKSSQDDVGAGGSNSGPYYLPDDGLSGAGSHPGEYSEPRQLHLSSNYVSVRDPRTNIVSYQRIIRNQSGEEVAVMVRDEWGNFIGTLDPDGTDDIGAEVRAEYALKDKTVLDKELAEHEKQIRKQREEYLRVNPSANLPAFDGVTLHDYVEYKAKEAHLNVMQNEGVMQGFDMVSGAFDMASGAQIGSWLIRGGRRIAVRKLAPIGPKIARHARAGAFRVSMGVRNVEEAASVTSSDIATMTQTSQAVSKARVGTSSASNSRSATNQLTRQSASEVRTEVVEGGKSATRKTIRKHKRKQVEVIKMKGVVSSNHQVDQGLLKKVQEKAESGQTYAVSEGSLSEGVNKRTTTVARQKDVASPHVTVSIDEIKSHVAEFKKKGINFRFQTPQHVGHAEVKNIIRYPNRPVYVTQAPCISCQNFFRAEAMYQGQRQIIVDQHGGIWIFAPDGSPPTFFSH